jgi:hypothetical protein
MVYMRQSPGGSCYGALWTAVVLEPKKPWALSDCFVLTLYMSGCVGLDRPPLGGCSGVFLAVKEVGFRG